jgi:amidophosphoribosyltransferase
LERTACSFERIYFSRGTDRDIYLERKKLGELLVPAIIKEVNEDFENTIFSFIPNTAEVSFFGMVQGLEKYTNIIRRDKIKALGAEYSDEDLDNILSITPRIEKIAVKDDKMRTFIADDVVRGEMVAHVYDVTYGIVRNHVDTLVLIDDSIVRGTTLRDSIIFSLSRLKPKKIVIVSSAPQIRYPDCYGIDMSKMKEFAAFKALVQLLTEHKKEHLLQEAYERCLAEEKKPVEEMVNQMQSLYDEFTYEEISDKIAEIVTPQGLEIEVKVIYQTVTDLHKACPNNTGDWYFTGNYPTVGGTRVVNRSFINYMEKSDKRAY